MKIEQLLEQQQDLTAVERFSALHDADVVPEAEGLYRHLIPAASPGQGQQYAFQVELDRCTGCKACVTGCHSRNGLDEGETWRFAWLLRGGDDAAPVTQTVTAACHHCADPACLEGCPVLAYEKDEKTGIVRHLDDQCIGCQYCVMKCPYDVPQYNESLGIVRKCDLCSERLAEGEAPACVQSCPNQAISVVVVDRNQAPSDRSGRDGFPHPSYTRPTTVYRSSRVLPEDLRVRGEAIPDEHGHLPLVAMLVLTQASIGLVMAALLSTSPWMAAAAAVVGAVGAAGAILHLGRPLYAFRALLGLRRSWLSREILAINAYLGASAAFALASLLAPAYPELVPPGLVTAAGLGALGAGVLVLACSAMVYMTTPRASWARAATLRSFATTSLLFAAVAAAGWTSLVVPACALVMGLSGLRILSNLRERDAGGAVGPGGLGENVAEAASESVAEATNENVAEATRVLFERMGVLPRIHNALYLVGGFALPALLLSLLASDPSLLAWPATAAALLLGTAELIDRYFFFATAPRPRATATRPL